LLAPAENFCEGSACINPPMPLGDANEIGLRLATKKGDEKAI
jgi:hypothetical protein